MSRASPEPQLLQRRRSIAVFAGITAIVAVCLGGLALLADGGWAPRAGALVLGVGGAGIVLAGRSVPLEWAGRAYLAVLLGGGTLVVAGHGAGMLAVAAVLFAVLVVLASAWESSDTGAGLWTLAGVAGYLVGCNLGRPLSLASPGAVAESALMLGVVPIGLVVLSTLSHSMQASLDQTLQLSEVARRKLMRSNDELGRAMERTEATAGRLATIVEALGEGLVAVSKDGRVELANPRLATLLDVPPIATGATAAEVLPAELVERMATGDGPVEIALPGDRVGEATFSRLGSGGTVVLLRDVTLARQIDRMKSDFAATVSHEMRTPLTSVLGFTKIVRGQLDKRVFPALPPDDAAAARTAEKVRANLEVVLTEGVRLTKLIDDVLDLSKLESGQMSWDLRPHDPAALIARALESTRGLFEERAGLEVVDATPAGLPAVLVDGDRILQVLVNLLGNAAKFTDAGTVTVSAEDRGAFVAVSVADTGIGMRSTDLDAVFEKFRQVGDVLTDRPRGTGLGLPICREIVEHHGGRIEASSRLGEGSVLTFTLPVDPTDRSAP
ncbi:MAG: hypothetical protein H6737_17530 [Alphaproteobacteria bacterium]|nr:hypothetical protein [Alphaproteobacteria bacterium]